MAKDEKTSNGYHKETFLIHGHPHDEQWQYSHHVIPPITASTAFRLDSTDRGAEGFRNFALPHVTDAREKPIYIYDRLAEPTVALLENSFKEIESGGSATAFASGMAAISAAFLSLCTQGSKIVSHTTLYGCTYSLLTNWLPRFGIDVVFVDFTNLNDVEAAIDDQTRVLYFETPVNPNLDIIDIEAASALAAKINENRTPETLLQVVVDNTFATPFCQRPLLFGADIVVHSLTKNVMGFGTDMGGMLVGPQQLHGSVRMMRKDFGGVVAPRAAWNILVYGLSSLAIRMERQNRSALEVASYLEEREDVASVRYPGLKSHPQHALAVKQMKDFRGRFAPGLMIYFELKGSGARLLTRAKAFMDFIANNSYVLTLAVSLGQAKTLIEAPALMTHSVYGADGVLAGMNPAAIRLAIGLEEPGDIIRDLESAFDYINSV
jgi:methionine-gamma-lyase